MYCLWTLLQWRTARDGMSWVQHRNRFQNDKSRLKQKSTRTVLQSVYSDVWDVSYASSTSWSLPVCSVPERTKIWRRRRYDLLRFRQWLESTATLSGDFERSRARKRTVYGDTRCSVCDLSYSPIVIDWTIFIIDDATTTNTAATRCSEKMGVHSSSHSTRFRLFQQFWERDLEEREREREMSMSVKMKMQMASMMGKSVMKNVIRDFGRDQRLVLCLSVRSIVRIRFEFLRFTFLRRFYSILSLSLKMYQIWITWCNRSHSVDWLGSYQHNFKVKSLSTKSKSKVAKKRERRRRFRTRRNESQDIDGWYVFSRYASQEYSRTRLRYCWHNHLF